MADLFDRDVKTIGKHINNALKEELDNSVVANFATTASDGKSYNVEHYSLYEMTRHAILIYSIAYLFVGWSVFSSAFFTGLNNGVISAAISFLRTLAFQVIAVLILPVFFGLNGVWAAIVVAEGCAFVFSLYSLLRYRNRYHYV